MATAAASSERQRQTRHRGNAGDGEPRLSPWQQRGARDWGGGGAVAMVTAAGGCPGGAAPLRHASFPATGAGCCGWGAAAKHICCGWMCEMTAVTADTLEMQSEQLRTGRLCGYVVHLAACSHGSYCASARVNFCIRNRECLGGYSWTWVLSRKTQRYVQNRNCSSPSDSQLRPWELHVVSQRSEVCNIPHPLA